MPEIKCDILAYIANGAKSLEYVSYSIQYKS